MVTYRTSDKITEYRLRANQLRMQAQTIRDLTSRSEREHLARQFDLLADNLEKTAARKIPH